MSRKALKVVVELKFRAVSCPGVHLPAKDDIYLSMCLMGQYRQSECVPAVFPLLFHEKMTFEKVFRHAVDPGDIAVMLEYEMIEIELVQLIRPGGVSLACFEEDARCFLFPEPKLVPSFSGVDREVLMTRAPYFPGIAPRLEFSTKTTIIECSADTVINIYPSVSMRHMSKRSRNCSSRPRTSSPQRAQTQGRRQSGRVNRGRHSSTKSDIPRSRSLSPLRAGYSQRLARHRLASSISQPMLTSWPGASRSASPQRSVVFTNSSSPLMRSSSTVRYSPTGRRRSLSNGLVGTDYFPPLSLLGLDIVGFIGYGFDFEKNAILLFVPEAGGLSKDDSSSSETHDPLDYHQDPDPHSAMWRSYREQARHSRSQSCSHREWEEVQERIRGLLTTPKAVRRLVYGATHSEVDEILARRSISPGPP